MRLLADQGFPASVEQNRSLDVEINRWNAERVSDLELIRECSASGFAGLLLLGVQSLVSSDFRRLAAQLGLYVGATLEDNPFTASRTIGNLLPILSREGRPGMVHVLLSREVRAWDDYAGTRTPTTS